MSVPAYAVSDSVSAVLGYALDGLSLRQNTIADNLANIDTPGFRAHCRRLAGPVLRQVEQFRAAGYDAVIIGADGSPSCGVRTTAGEAGWGGRPTAVDDPVPVPGEGVWIEVLRAAFAEAGLAFPRATGFDVGLPEAEMPVAVHELRRFLRQSATRFAG